MATVQIDFDLLESLEGDSMAQLQELYRLRDEMMKDQKANVMGLSSLNPDIADLEDELIAAGKLPPRQPTPPPDDED